MVSFPPSPQGAPVSRRCALGALAAGVLLPMAAGAQVKAAPAGAVNPSNIIDGIGGIEWAWTPRETVATMLAKATMQPTVAWIGRITDVRVGRAVTGEADSVLEFLAAFMPYAKPGPDALNPPVRVRPETGELFVVSLRSPRAEDALIRNLRQSMLDQTHYTVVVGEPRFTAPFGRHQAIFLQTRRATVSQQLRVEIVRD
jgi:hypothetical protein